MCYNYLDESLSRSRGGRDGRPSAIQFAHETDYSQVAIDHLGDVLTELMGWHGVDAYTKMHGDGRDLGACANSWKIEDGRPRPSYFCGERLFCSVCGSAKAGEGARKASEVFEIVHGVLNLDVYGYEFIPTVHRDISAAMLGILERDCFNDFLALPRHVLADMGFVEGGITTLHSTGESDPSSPHFHTHTMVLPFWRCGHVWGGRKIGFLDDSAGDRGIFYAFPWLDHADFLKFRDLVLMSWNYHLSLFCEKWGIDFVPSKDIWWGAFADSEGFGNKVKYEMRYQMRDALRHAGADYVEFSDMAAKDALRDAVWLQLQTAYFVRDPQELVDLLDADKPPRRFRRVRWFGWLSNFKIGEFMEKLGYERNERKDDADDPQQVDLDAGEGDGLDPDDPDFDGGVAKMPKVDKSIEVFWGMGYWTQDESGVWDMIFVLRDRVGNEYEFSRRRVMLMRKRALVPRWRKIEG